MKQLWILIGPSGSGKSTIANKIKQMNQNTELYSFDEMRLRLYGGTYSEAWEASTKDKQFNERTRLEFNALLAKGVDIVVDNTNLYPKSRMFFISNAKKLGYRINGVVFNNPLQTLIDRQLTRPDKCVPTHVVIRQYNTMILPQDSEFDFVIESTTL